MEPKVGDIVPSSESAAVASVGVVRDLCESALTCLAYKMYELDDESKAVLLTRNGLNSDDPANDQAADGFVRVEDLVGAEDEGMDRMRQLVLESARSCPFNAIVVRDEQGRQVWPPLP